MPASSSYSHHHRQACPHHLCCGWFQHQLDAVTNMQIGQIETFRCRHLGGWPQYWCLKLLYTASRLQPCARSGCGFWRMEVSTNEDMIDLCMKRCLLTNLTMSPAAADFNTEARPCHTPLPAFGHKGEAAASFWGCNVSKNMMEMHWFLHLQMVITHISLPEPRPQSQRSAAPRRFRQCNKSISKR